MKNDSIDNIKLKTDLFENIMERLKELVAADTQIVENVYAGNVRATRDCACKECCDSW